MLVIGTANPRKVREIAAICRPLGVEIDTLELDVEETGDTFAENALIKARAYSAARPGHFVLVEDSGLAVNRLGGLPGPWSAKFHDLDLETRTASRYLAALGKAHVVVEQPGCVEGLCPRWWTWSSTCRRAGKRCGRTDSW